MGKNKQNNLELQNGDILCIYLKDLCFFDIFPLKDGETFAIDKFQAAYCLRPIFNNSRLLGSQNIDEEWVTLLRYEGNDRFTEYYTGMSIFTLPNEVIPFHSFLDYANLYDFLKERSLFFAKENSFSCDSTIKNKIVSQQSKVDNIISAIDRARIQVVENFNSKTDKKNGELVRFDIPFAYEENAIYNFTHGLCLERKLQIKNEEDAE